jgi:hypothetical protein
VAALATITTAGTAVAASPPTAEEAEVRVSVSDRKISALKRYS